MRRSDDAFKAEIYRRKARIEKRATLLRSVVSVGVTAVAACMILVSVLVLRGSLWREPMGNPSVDGETSFESNLPSSLPNITPPGTVGDPSADSSSNTESAHTGATGGSLVSTGSVSDATADANSSTDSENGGEETPSVIVMVNGRRLQGNSVDAALSLLSQYVSVPGYGEPSDSVGGESEETPPSTEGSRPTVDGPGTSDGGPEMDIEIITEGETVSCFVYSRIIVCGDLRIKISAEQASELFKAFQSH